MFYFVKKFMIIVYTIMGIGKTYILIHIWKMLEHNFLLYGLHRPTLSSKR